MVMMVISCMMVMVMVMGMLMMGIMFVIMIPGMSLLTMIVRIPQLVVQNSTQLFRLLVRLVDDMGVLALEIK